MVQAAEKHIKWGFFEIAIWSIIHTKTLENTVFSRVFCYLGSSERTSKNPNFKVSELTHPNDC